MFCKVRIDKSEQRSNWEAEMLTERQIAYGATDAWASLAVYETLASVEYQF